MIILEAIVGIIGGLVIYSIARFILERMEYTNDLHDDSVTLDLSFWHTMYIVVSVMIELVNFCFYNYINLMFWVIGLCIGIFTSLILICRICFSATAKYMRIQKKMDKIKENIHNMPLKKTKTQEDAVEILERALERMSEQAGNILLADSVKIAKKLETNNSLLDIQYELDELDALQKLNK